MTEPADTAGTHAGRRSRRGIVLESLLLAAVALFFLNFNPLGAMSVGHRYSQDLVYAWFGGAHWLYPRVSAELKSRVPDHPRVVVLLVDDAALALRGAQWPVPVDFHAQLFAELEALRPRAVLLDFLLIDQAPPEAACALLGATASLKRSGIRAYVAVTSPDELAKLDRAQCRDEKGQPLLATKLLTPVSVRLQVDATDFVNRRYPFEERASAAAAGSGVASAAVAMYCDTRPAPGQCVSDLTRDRSSEAGFELAWAPAGDPFNQRWTRARCDAVPSATQAILFKKSLPRETECPPIATLFASALLNPAEDASTGVGNEELLDLMDGAFVLIGGNFRGAGDLMTTPLHTRLPGVYYHAVALDNLFAFDGAPKIRKDFRGHRLSYYVFDLFVLWLLALIFLKRQAWLSTGRAASAGPFDLSPAARAFLANVIGRLPTVAWILGAAIFLLLLATYPLLQAIVVLAVVAILVLLEIRVAAEGELLVRFRSLALYLAALALSLVVVAAAIWVGYQWLSLPPVDWVGYLSFAAFGFFVAHTAILEFARRVDEIHGTRGSQGGAK